MSFLPDSFVVPEILETDLFRLRPLTIHDVIKDYDAVMSSREDLWKLFGQCWGWPREDLTLEQDLIDLGWHQKEGQMRSSFVYAVMSPDEKRMLGCVYIDPPTKVGFDAEVFYWVRSSELEFGLAEKLGLAFENWLTESWPFRTIAFPCRRIAWDDWKDLPDIV